MDNQSVAILVTVLGFVLTLGTLLFAGGRATGAVRAELLALDRKVDRIERKLDTDAEKNAVAHGDLYSKVGLNNRELGELASELASLGRQVAKA